MMTDTWYQWVPAESKIAQGDLIMDCPVLEWTGTLPEGTLLSDTLKNRADGVAVDVVVMTQACDLAQNKVDNVIVCAHYSLSEYKTSWEIALQEQQQNPTSKAWRKFCDSICDGYVWNLSMLNSRETGSIKMERRIVDFHRVYSLPIDFLQSYVTATRRDRLTLLPPYREHLSQAFARFFMRVGLPVNIAKAWD